MRARNTWAIYLSFFIALTLSALPVPEAVQWWRPEWAVLILVYWLVALPERVGLGTAWGLGILMDALEGSLLGLNALGMTLVAYVTLLSYQRIRMFTVIQQGALLFALVALHQLISHWIKGILGLSVQNVMFLIPAFVSALIWPVIFVVLRGVRRQFDVR